MTSRPFLSAFAIFAFLLMSASSFAEQSDAFKTPALGGYSPVSCFTVGEAQLGAPEFAVDYNGKRYFLTSEEQVALFEADPGKYQPRHEVCTYSLALGMVRPLNPTKFKIVDGSLLLFHVDEKKDALLEWHRSAEDERELIERADNNLFLVKF